VGENSDPILSRLWTKVPKIFRRCKKPLVLFNTLFRLPVSRFIQKIFAIKSRSRRWFLGPRFVGEGIRQISDMHFQITLTSDHVAEYGLVPFSELRE